MKAVLLCAGFGKRLGKLTENCPKPLLKVAGLSLVERQINSLKLIGVKDFYLNLHYLGDQIKNYLGSGERLGVNIYYKYEKTPSGTAGGVKIFEEELKLEKNFFVIYGDIVTNENLNRLVDFHSSKDSLATIYLHKRNKSNSLVEIESSGKITKFLERPSDKERQEYLDNKQNQDSWVNSAIYILDHSVLSMVPAHAEYDFPRDVFTKLVKDGSLYGLPIQGERFAIDSEERLNLANKFFINEEMI